MTLLLDLAVDVVVLGVWGVFALLAVLAARMLYEHQTSSRRRRRRWS